MSTPVIEVRSLDAHAIVRDEGLLRLVGPQLQALAETRAYDLLVQVMQSEKRRRAEELADKIGSPQAAALAAEIRAALAFHEVVLSICAAYVQLIQKQAEERVAEAETPQLDSDQIPA